MKTWGGRMGRHGAYAGGGAWDARPQVAVPKPAGRGKPWVGQSQPARPSRGVGMRRAGRGAESAGCGAGARSLTGRCGRGPEATEADPMARARTGGGGRSARVASGAGALERRRGLTLVRGRRRGAAGAGEAQVTREQSRGAGEASAPEDGVPAPGLEGVRPAAPLVAAGPGGPPGRPVRSRDPRGRPAAVRRQKVGTVGDRSGGGRKAKGGAGGRSPASCRARRVAHAGAPRRGHPGARPSGRLGGLRFGAGPRALGGWTGR